MGGLIEVCADGQLLQASREIAGGGRKLRKHAAAFLSGFAQPRRLPERGTTTVAAVIGVVTCSNLTLNKRATGNTLKLSSAGLNLMISGPITVK
jgi:hypothetical protein